MEVTVNAAPWQALSKAFKRQLQSWRLWQAAGKRLLVRPQRSSQNIAYRSRTLVALNACISKMAFSPNETTALLGRKMKQVRSELEASDLLERRSAATGKRKSLDDKSPTVVHTTSTNTCYSTFHTFEDGTVCEQRHFDDSSASSEIDLESIPAHLHQAFRSPSEVALSSAVLASKTTVEPTLPTGTEQREKQENRQVQATRHRDSQPDRNIVTHISSELLHKTTSGMSDQASSADVQKSPAKEHKPLVVGRTKPLSTNMESSSTSASAAAANEELKKNVETNTTSAAPAEGATPKPKKEKAPKQPKQPKAAPPSAPLSPALLDLRVGHILRAINHPNADSLYVSTIAMGDAEGTEHTQVDEETGKVVRTVCSGLNGLVPLAEMQNRKVIVVANLKPVNMRSIKSAAMVLAASPKAEEGADPHAADRVVELVSPPEDAEAGEPVYFEGWEYGDGKGPEKVLNPKKKQWEAIQPGFYTSEDLVVGFDASKSEIEGEKERKGDLVVKGKGKCTVKTLKGAVVR